MAEAEPEVEAEAEAKPEAEPKAEAEPEGEGEASAEEKASGEAEAEAEARPKAEPERQGEVPGEEKASGEAEAEAESPLCVCTGCVCPQPFLSPSAEATPESITGEPGPRLDLPTAELVTSLSMNILVMVVALLLGPGTRRYLRRLLTR